MKTGSLRPDGAVIHYHEIALKGENRPLFIRRLISNIEKASETLGIERVLAPRGRIVIYFSDRTSWEKVLARLEKVFGIANFSPIWKCSTNLKTLKKTISTMIEDRTFSSFRIAARRAHKGYPLTSMEVNDRLGRFVQEQSNAQVILKDPELTIFVEILKEEAFIYLEKHPGPGGLPVGVSGTVACLLSGGIDSPVAAYHMMKRGCRVVFVHFHGHPYLSKASLEKAEDLAEHLTPYQWHSKLYAVPFGEIQRQIVLSVPPPLRVVLYRRFMFKIAEELGLREGAKALVTGESLGQVASQTLDNLGAISDGTQMPILRPLIGWDKQEIISRAQTLGTYPISILPDQDCCRLFIPSHPSTGASLADVRKAEGHLDIHGLVKMGLDLVEVRNFG